MFLQTSLWHRKKGGPSYQFAQFVARGKGGRVRLKHCQQPNIQNGDFSYMYETPVLWPPHAKS